MVQGVSSHAGKSLVVTGRRPQPIASAFDQLADAVEGHLDRRWLEDRVRGR